MRLIAVGLLAACAMMVTACAAPSASVESSSSGQSSSVAVESSSSAEVERPPAVSASEAKTLPARDYSALKEQVSAIANEYYLDAGISFVDLNAGPGSSFDVRGDWSCVSASMIKLLILAAFLDGVDQGKFSMDDEYTLKSSDIVGGTGSLQGRGAGAQVSLAEMARLMISESDNVAANVLTEMMGMDAVNAEAAKLGLKGTQMNRLMMDEEAISNHVENRMSANDAARIFEFIWRGELVSPEASRFALEALEAQTDGQGIIQGLPADVVFAHKTGTLPQVRNDGGIVEAERPYVLVVLCAGGEETASLELMTRISELVYAQSQAA